MLSKQKQRKRLLRVLRKELRFCGSDEVYDEFLLATTKGTLLRCRVELQLALHDVFWEILRSWRRVWFYLRRVK